MIHIIIKEPVWKNKSVSIAQRKIVDDIKLEIAYQDKYGNRPYPDFMYMRMNEALKYQPNLDYSIKFKQPMINIPIKDFKPSLN